MSTLSSQDFNGEQNCQTYNLFMVLVLSADTVSLTKAISGRFALVIYGAAAVVAGWPTSPRQHEWRRNRIDRCGCDAERQMVYSSSTAVTVITPQCSP